MVCELSIETINKGKEITDRADKYSMRKQKYREWMEDFMAGCVCITAASYWSTINKETHYLLLCHVSPSWKSFHHYHVNLVVCYLIKNKPSLFSFFFQIKGRARNGNKGRWILMNFQATGCNRSSIRIITKITIC